MAELRAGKSRVTAPLDEAPGAQSDPAKPHVTFLTLSLEVGGAERHLASVAPELVRRGWPVTIVCLNQVGAYGDAVRAAGVEVIGPPVEVAARASLKPQRLLLAGLATARFLAYLLHRRPTIAHFFLPEPYLLGAPSALLARIPIRIMSRRDINVHFDHWPAARHIEAQLQCRMTAVLGNSKRVIQDLVSEGCPQERLGLIYNGANLADIDLPVDRDRIRASLGLAPDDLVGVMVANLVSYKGHADLLNALAIVNARAPKRLKLLLPGRDDGEMAALQNQAIALGLGGDVQLLGERSDLAELLKAGDIGVHASHKEGFSNAVIESMAAGLPMVVTDVGGNAEAVQHGENGVVVPPHEPEKIAEALQALMGDAGLRSRQGLASRRRVEKHFSLPACVDRYEALYRGLVAGQKPTEIEAVSLGQAI